MICSQCSAAADRGLGRHAHCRDEKCPCQHRPIVGAPRVPTVYVGSVVAISADPGERREKLLGLTVGTTLTASDPEPPVGTLVRDDCGVEWVNDGHRPCCWVRPDLVEQGIHDPESWRKIAGNYGPVTILEWGNDG